MRDFGNFVMFAARSLEVGIRDGQPIDAILDTTFSQQALEHPV